MKKRIHKKRLNQHKRALLARLELKLGAKVKKVANAKWNESLYFTSSALPNYLFGTDGQAFWGEHNDNIDRFRFGRTELEASDEDEFIEKVVALREIYWQNICRHRGLKANSEEEAQALILKNNSERLADLKEKKDWLRSGAIFNEFPNVIGVAMRQHPRRAWKYEVAVIAPDETVQRVQERLGRTDFFAVEFAFSFADGLYSDVPLVDSTFETILPEGVFWGSKAIEPMLTFQKGYCSRWQRGCP